MWIPRVLQYWVIASRHLQTEVWLRDSMIAQFHDDMTTLQPVPDDVVPEVSFVLDVRSPSVFAFSVHPAGNEGALVNVAAHKLRHAFARV